MNELQIFKSNKFGEVRVVKTENNEPLFCLADLCKAVGLTNPSTVKTRLDKEDVQLIDLHALNYTEGIGNSFANFVNESGFFDVLLQSSSPSVKPFRKWVTSEVLPSIRKHGAYMSASVIEKALTDPDTIIQLATQLKEERKQREILQQKSEQQSKEIELQAPKVETYDKFIDNNGVHSFKEVAGLLGYGRNKMMAQLRGMNILTRSNIPYQRFLDYGYFEVKETVQNGFNITTTYVSAKGVDYLRKKLM